MDLLEAKEEVLGDQEDRLKRQEEKLREKARIKGRKLAQLTVRKIDTVFAPRNLDPDDAKVVFHPIDYVVFRGYKEPSSTKEVILLDRANKAPEQMRLQKSIERAVAQGRYDWFTLRIGHDGTIALK